MKRNRSAFTFVGLLVVLAVVAILAAMLLPALAKAKARAQRIQCVNNLKQCALAARIWEGDHNDQYPMAISNSLGGTLDWVPDGNAFRHFQVMSNELNTPKILVCPADKRQAAANFVDLSNEHLSYFVGLDAKETDPQALLYGDRNITNGLAPIHGVLNLKPDVAAGWTAELHNRVGNIAFADGSVQQLSTFGMRKAIESTGDQTNRIALPE